MMPPTHAVRDIRFVAIATGLFIAASSIKAQSFAVDSTSCAARASALSATDTSRAARGTTAASRSDSAVRNPGTARPARSDPTVIVFAAATAREVTFAKEPEIRVRLCGGLDSVRVVERRNLPNPVVAGRTYRDVYVAVEIFARLNADCVVAALTSTARDSTGQRNACAALQIDGTRTRPPNLPENQP
jgi:hypothetical protein